MLSLAKKTYLAAVVLWTAAACADPAPPLPPIIVISIDTLAADNLPTYGYERDTAPNLALLAEEAVVFEHCVTNAPWTLPSYLALLTGIYSEAHRLEFEREEEVPMWQRWGLDEGRDTLAERLQARGYRTAAFVDNLWLTERFGFAQGFDHYDASAGERDRDDLDGGIRHVSERALAWLDGNAKGDPFFLFLHAFDVHGPYLAPEPFRGHFAGADGPYDPNHSAPFGGPSDCYGILHEYLLTEEARAELRPPVRLPSAPIADAYDEGIRMVDHNLGLLFKELRERGLFEESIIVITADHGETMVGGDYWFGHGVFDEAVLRVPLFVRLPGGAHGGTRVEQRVQLVDLYPTLLELADTLPGEQIHGRSLRGVLAGEPLSDRPVLSEGGLSRQSALFSGRWKLVERTPGLESSIQHVLSTPGLARLWHAEILPWAENDETARKAVSELIRHEVDVDAILGRIEREGLHRPLLEELRDRPDVQGIAFVVRGFFLEPIHELYDLESDPGAQRNIAAAEPDRVAELLELMDAERAKARAARVRDKASVEPTFSEEDLDELRKLGYAED